MKTLGRPIVLAPLYWVAFVLCFVACGKEPSENHSPDSQQDTSTSTFSIGYNRRVYFSPGNLDIRGRLFVGREWEYGGYFGWGTGDAPGTTSMNNGDYRVFHDWGDYLGYVESGWRTMQKSEWEYMLLYRRDAEYKRGTGTVNGVHGMLLLPDRWQVPEGMVFSPGCISWEDNVFTREQWERMKEEGAVFLPAGDYIWNGAPPHEGASGLYWTATPVGDKEAYYVCFYDGRVYASVVNQRCFRLSVRLVRDVD